MSKLSKRAITLFVIATMVLSMLSAFIAVPVMATHTSTATVAFTAGASKDISDLSSLDVVVTNVGPDPIETVIIDFSGTDFTGIGAGALPGVWAGSVPGFVQTYTGDTILSGASVTFVPTVTNPATMGEATNPVVTTSDATALVAATLTIGAVDSAVTYDAVVAGSAGNAITIAHVDPLAASQTLGIVVTGTDIVVNLATDVGGLITSTATEVVAAITADPQVLVVATAGGTGLGVAAVLGVTNLAGGTESTTNYPTTLTGTLTIVIEASPDFTFDYVSSDVVQYGDVLTVIGSGVTSGNLVNIYWDYVTAANKLNTTTGLPSAKFECEVTVPSADFGEHYLWAVDVNSGTPASFGPISVIPKIKLSPTSGLKDDDVTIKGYGFDVDSVISFDYDLPVLSDDLGTDETDDLGYFEYTFEVADTVTYGLYTVTATDADNNWDDAIFTVGAAITLDKTVGPAGTIVKVDGRGFTEGEIITEVEIKMDGVPVSTKDGEDVAIPSSGLFTAYIVIPSVLKGEHEITIFDVAVPITATFEVDGETSITVTPGYGTPGTVLTVKGYNFTRVSGTDVTLKLELRTAEATTDSSGSFTANIVIPPCNIGDRYWVTATDEGLCYAEDEVLVTIIFLQLSDLAGPVGSAVTLMGSGFTAGPVGKWNATFGDLDLIATKDITGIGTLFSDTFHVPSLPSGTYTINVLDVVEDIEVGIDFTITEQAELSVSRAAIPNKYNLTLEGVNFAEYIDEDVYDTTWWIYNSTDAWNIDDNVTQGEDVFPSDAPVTDEDGEFTAWYLIPEFLELGSYCINCTTVSNDEVDPDIIQTAKVCIELVPEEVVLNIGSPSYARGQTITFVIKATLKKDPFYLGIKDPEGSEYFNSTWETPTVDAWKTLGSWFYIPSNLQIDKNTQWLYTLPTDATPGRWTYSFWDDDKEYANGTFQVTELTELEQLRDDIGELSEDMEGIGTSVVDLATTVAGVSGAAAEAAAAAATAATAAAEAQAAAEAGIAAIDDLSEISQDALDAANNAMSAADAAKDAADAGLAAANAAQTTAQQAADAADKAADAAEATQKQTGGLTGLVYGAIFASLIAALAAIVSLMQISRRIAG